MIDSKYVQTKNGRGDLCHVYIHCYPDGTPFYVGIGRGKRCYDMHSRSVFHHRVQRKIKRLGGEVLIQIDRTCPIPEAISREIELIAHYGRRDIGTGILVNHSPGGQFIPEKGRTRSSELLKGNKNRLGTTQSTETRKKISEASRRLWNCAEHRENLSTKMKQRWAEDDDYRRRVSEGVKAGRGGHYFRTEETREKIRQNMLGSKQSEETKAKRRATWAAKFGPGHVSRREKKRLQLEALAKSREQ